LQVVRFRTITAAGILRHGGFDPLLKKQALALRETVVSAYALIASGGSADY